ncbi:MAG TPA: hypothetical protein VGJ20_11285 [Xanthobacteraceae bacterium]|jgi:hypothetical protein
MAEKKEQRFYQAKLFKRNGEEIFRWTFYASNEEQAKKIAIRKAKERGADKFEITTT